MLWDMSEPRGGKQVSLPIRAETMVLVLHGVAAFLFLAWLWMMVRAQQQASPYIGGFGDDDGAGLSERIDIVAQTLYPLAYAGVVAGAAQILGILTQRDRGPEPSDEDWAPPS